MPAGGLSARPKAKEKMPQLQHYQLGQELGRGGFGAVFSALNLETGEIVAIKQVSLANVDEEEMASIEMEVRLLKRLQHQNIVRYIDTLKSGDHLHIVLEFMENGSLAQVVKKFGNFSESLVAMYISQVLQGLAYLHEQGVLHRDIKGANILTAKDGHVKLGDFGVAINVSESQQEECSVVGTPYWMAPEIIEMASPTAACDVWSVGCTIIELLSGKPPYFDLAPMAALFRIVQDDYPPLPEGISPALRDFLFQCFTKEPRLRKSAQELLRHPWLSTNRSTAARAHDEGTRLVQAAPDADERDREGIISTIRLYTSRSDGGAAPDAPEGGAAPEDVPTTPRSAAPAAVADDDDDDDVFWGDEDDAAEGGQPAAAAAAAAKLSAPPQVLAQMKALQGDAGERRGSVDAADETKAAVAALLADELDDDNLFWDDSDEDAPVASRLTMTTETGAAPDMLTKGSGSAKLARFADNDDDDEDGDDWGLADDDADAGPLKLQLRTAASMDEEDGGFEDQVFDELDFEGSADRDVHARKIARVLALLELLAPTTEASTILEACEELVDIFHEYPSTRQRLVTQHGVVPIMEMLEVKSPEVLHALLRVVNQIVEGDKKVQENLSLAGVMPVMVRLASAESQHDDILLEAGKFVRQVCQTSKLTLQMFIACGGLHVLLHFLQVTDEQQAHAHVDKELMWTAIDGITGAFTLTTIPKNDFCRLFVKGGLLRHLMGSFAQILAMIDSADAADQSDQEQARLWGYAEQVVTIVGHFSRGDQVVKGHLCEPAVLQALMRLLNPDAAASRSHNNRADARFAALVVQLVRCVKNLSMEPAALDALEAAGAIPTLVKLLDAATGGAKDLQNHAINTMFYLCRINKVRQEQAALCGVVPHLKQVVSARSPLRQFALPVFCDLAHASHASRERLWAHGGVDVYLGLLGEPYWQVHALNALAAWVAADYGGKVVGVLLQPANLLRVVRLFRTAQAGDFENLVEPTHELIARSVALNQALGRSGLFMAGLVDRLLYPKAIVRKHLLRALKELVRGADDPVGLIMSHNLVPLVARLARDEAMVVVQEMAGQLEEDFLSLSLG